MAQHDYQINNQGFPATRADLNNALSAIATNNSGTSAPSTQYAGQFWIDTTTSTWTMYIHDGTDDIQFATIDTSANTVNFIDSALASDVVINTSGDITTTGAFTSVGIDDNATSTAITIDSSENVGIGTTNAGANRLLVEGGNVYIKDHLIIGSGDGSTISSDSVGNPLLFGINLVEKMRIDSSGYVHVGRTSDSASAGITLRADGIIKHVVDGNVLHVLNRLTSDGTLVAFQQAGVEEGNITVSGATVAYNGFTGTHWSRFIDNSKPNILRGTILESLDEMCDWYNLEFNDNDGNTQKIPYVLQDGQSNGDVITYDWKTEKKDENDNDIIEQVQATIIKETDIKHVKSKVSDTVDAKNVYGVFMAYDEDGEGYNDFCVASVGSFVVRIKQGETVAKGDLLQSNGDGTAKVQTDDNVKSSSFAKVLSTTVIETYEDGSYLVPCSLMC